jgi:hypothetical protein
MIREFLHDFCLGAEKIAAALLPKFGLELAGVEDFFEGG